MLSGNTHNGPAMDEIDAICKSYKQCLKCAQEQHGTNCVPEFINNNPTDFYNVDIRKNRKTITCLDAPNSCNRKFLMFL